MKRYISIEEDRILYVRTPFSFPGSGAPGNSVFVDSQPLEAGKEEESLRALAGRRRLRGKRVTLLVKREVGFVQQELPAASLAERRKMAENQLLAEEVDFGAAAVEPSDDELGRAGIYYIGRKALQRELALLRSAGIGCSGILAWESCMAVLAGAVWRHRTVLLIRPVSGSVSLFVLKNGHVLRRRCLGLRPERFLALGGEALLWEELEMAAAGLQEEPGERAGLAVVDTGHIPLAKEGLNALRKRLGIDCLAGDLRILLGEAEPPEVETLKPGPARFAGAERDRSLLGGGSLFSRLCLLLAAVNLAAALALTGELAYRQRQGEWRLERLEAEADGAAGSGGAAAGGAGGRSETGEAGGADGGAKAGEAGGADGGAKAGAAAGAGSLSRCERAAAGAAERRREMLVRREALESADFAALTGALTEGMRLTELRAGEEAAVTCVVRLEDPSQITPLVERIRAFGRFSAVSHSRWEQTENGCLTVIHAWKGGDGNGI